MNCANVVSVIVVKYPGTEELQTILMGTDIISRILASSVL
jgi:hypothetical protein